MAGHFLHKGFYLKLQTELDQLEERCLTAEGTAAAAKRRVDEQERWAKRQVSDNRALAFSAQAGQAAAEQKVWRLQKELAWTRFQLTQQPQSTELPRDDLLPPSQPSAERPKPPRKSKEAAARGWPAGAWLASRLPGTMLRGFINFQEKC